MVLLTLAGCHPHQPLPPEVLPEPVPVVEARLPVTGPVTWRMGGAPGLCLAVPPGWTGTTGPPPLVLEIEDAAGERVALSVSPAPFPSEREGYQLLFEDDGAYRTVPLLEGGGSRSWQSVDPYGPFVQAWYGRVGGAEVEVAVTTPLNGATAGYDALHALIRTLCVDAAP